MNRATNLRWCLVGELEPGDRVATLQPYRPRADLQDVDRQSRGHRAIVVSADVLNIRDDVRVTLNMGMSTVSRDYIAPTYLAIEQRPVPTCETELTSLTNLETMESNPNTTGKEA